MVMKSLEQLSNWVSPLYWEFKVIAQNEIVFFSITEHPGEKCLSAN